MRILHILDHSIPLHSGYTFRTLAILKEQRDLGWETFHVTSAKHTGSVALEEEVDGWHFYRTPEHSRFAGRLPILNQIAVINGLARRVADIVRIIKPDLLHAHSPALNAIPALIAARKASIPVIYEVRAFWEDAAVDHGTSSEWGVRYRLTRGLENFALRRVDAITTICEGLRNDMIGRGIAPEKITTIPNAVDIEKFAASRPANESLKEQFGLKSKRIIGFIGSFYAYEGLDILLRALPIMLLQLVPKIAVAPLFLVWLGFGLESKVLLTVLMTFFPLLLASISGFQILDTRLLYLTQSMGASAWQTFRYLRVPAALPVIFSGIKTSATIAATAAIVAEFVGANKGLGYVLLRGTSTMDIELTFAVLVVLTIIGIVINYAVEFSEWAMTPWQRANNG